MTTETEQDTSRHAWVEPPTGSPEVPRVIAELIADRLGGLCVAHGDCIAMTCTVTSNDTIVLDISRLAVTGREASARVVVHLSAPGPAAEPEADGADAVQAAAAEIGGLP